MIADTLGVTKQAANQRLRKPTQGPSSEPAGSTIIAAVAAEPPIA
jgi:hypothetical protein